MELTLSGQFAASRSIVKTGALKGNQTSRQLRRRLRQWRQESAQAHDLGFEFQRLDGIAQRFESGSEESEHTKKEKR